MPRYLIGMGSSHPNGAFFIEKAIQALEKNIYLELIAKSRLYLNPAFGGQTLFHFTNAACKLETALHPDTLWFLLSSIEISLGRVRFEKNGPRTIDLDILWSSLMPLQTDYLTIPHPEFYKRPFALKPASDIGLS